MSFNFGDSHFKYPPKVNVLLNIVVFAISDTLTTTSRNQGWVPGMSKGFHLKPASQFLDWVVLPWLAILQPSHEPHASWPGTNHTDKEWKKMGSGRGKTKQPRQCGTRKLQPVQPCDWRTTLACTQAMHRWPLLPLKKDNCAANLHYSLLLTLLNCI